MSSFRSIVAGVDRVAAVGAAPVALAGAYLGTITAMSRTVSAPEAGAVSTRFTVVVPAHNEALGIAATVRGLFALDYPSDLYRVHVIADNCADDTAARARAAGAVVTERVDERRKSKGFALTDVFPALLADGWSDALVVVDADTHVSPNLLRSFAARIQRGAKALQAEYAVANPDDGWRTQLMAVAFACFHDVRSRGRERLRLSSGLRGNGMCFTREALLLVPHEAASLVEDLEYGIALARKGVRVEYVHEARVLAEMPVSDSGAASQRKRWEEGRSAIRRSLGPTLVRESLRRRDRVLADLAADVLIPPLATVAAATAGTAAVGTTLSVLLGRPARTLVPATFGVLGLATHVVAGWHRSGTGWQGIRALGQVPGYVLWKSGIRSKRDSTSTEWVRTTRIAEERSDHPEVQANGVHVNDVHMNAVHMNAVHANDVRADAAEPYPEPMLRTALSKPATAPYVPSTRSALEDHQNWHDQHRLQNPAAAPSGNRPVPTARVGFPKERP